MEKLIHDEGKDTTRTTISNDGATIVKLLNIVHPAVNCGSLHLRVFCGVQNCMWKMLSIQSA
jgi:hypothetical protein